jgi:transposase
MTKRNRRKFTDEFKLEAIRMVDESDKTIAQVSRDLGINSNLIGRWKQELSDREIEAGRVDDKDAEIARLRAELRDMKEDHDILKKAAAYFAKHSR